MLCAPTSSPLQAPFSDGFVINIAGSHQLLFAALLLTLNFYPFHPTPLSLSLAALKKMLVKNRSIFVPPEGIALCWGQGRCLEIFCAIAPAQSCSLSLAVATSPSRAVMFWPVAIFSSAPSSASDISGQSDWIHFSSHPIWVSGSWAGRKKKIFLFSSFFPHPQPRLS